MKNLNRTILIVLGIVLPNVAIASPDDGVTIRMMDADERSSEAVTRQIELPEAASEQAREHAEDGLKAANRNRNRNRNTEDGEVGHEQDQDMDREEAQEHAMEREREREMEREREREEIQERDIDRDGRRAADRDVIELEQNDRGGSGRDGDAPRGGN